MIIFVCVYQGFKVKAKFCRDNGFSKASTETCNKFQHPKTSPHFFFFISYWTWTKRSITEEAKDDQSGKHFFDVWRKSEGKQSYRCSFSGFVAQLQCFTELLIKRKFMEERDWRRWRVKLVCCVACQWCSCSLFCFTKLYKERRRKRKRKQQLFFLNHWKMKTRWPFYILRTLSL